MTRKQAKELLPVIQAFAEGKTIQYYCKSENPHWIDMEPNEVNQNVDFSNDTSRYRIKPEPKYRPFANNKECWNEMLRHKPFGWVKVKNAECDYYIIDGVYYSENYEAAVVSMSGETFNYKEMIDNYLFADGTPFGIKIEE